MKLTVKLYQKIKKQVTQIFKKIMKNKQSPLQRINRIMEFLHKRGNNKESVNKVYRNILKNRL